MSILTLNHVTKYFGDRKVIDAISLSLKEGEFLSILGKSGSGKTTLLRLIAGFESVDEGTIELSNAIISSKGFSLPTEKRDIGIVFQDHALWPHMTIFENVAFPLKVRKQSETEIKKSVEEALSLVGMTGFAKTFPHQLSGGEAQRVALARSLVQKPKLIIFDEPLASLDALLRYELQGMIKKLHHQHSLSCIYITHDQGEAMRLSDRIAVLEEGKIIQVDTPETIYLRPQNASVARLIGQGACAPVEIIESYDDYATVRLVEHTFQVRASSKTKEKTGTICLRSENIEILPSDDKISHHALAAMVEDCSYMGGCYQGDLRLVDMPEIILRKKTDIGLSPNSRVKITIHGGWLMGV